jgi:hypothetical protein
MEFRGHVTQPQHGPGPACDKPQPGERLDQGQIRTYDTAHVAVHHRGPGGPGGIGEKCLQLGAESRHLGPGDPAGDDESVRSHGIHTTVTGVAPETHRPGVRGPQLTGNIPVSGSSPNGAGSDSFPPYSTVSRTR